MPIALENELSNAQSEDFPGGFDVTGTEIKVPSEGWTRARPEKVSATTSPPAPLPHQLIAGHGPV